MRTIDALTLQALLLALLQLDEPLPQPLHQEICQTGEALQNEQRGVADQIRTLVRKHDRLNQLYQDAYDRLQKQSPTQERAQSFHAAPDTLPVTWREIAVPILTADDFRAAARELLKHTARLPKASGDIRVFLVSLQQTVSAVDAQAIEVLRSLEKRPLTVKGLVYLMGISQTQARDLVQQLCQAGYIDRTTSSILHKVFPALRNKQRTCEEFDLETYFTLTAKGHFLLHPVLTFGPQTGAMLR